MAATDLPAVQTLLSQLGYQVGVREVEQRYRAVALAEGHSAMVAVQDRRAVAFLHVHARPVFEKPPEAVVQALVVDRACRGAGIGRALMTAAEAWALERDFATVTLTPSVSRIAAHAFYHALGFKGIATSYLLQKHLQV